MIDPICGMKGHIKVYGHYFCSEHCVKQYEKENNIDSDECVTCSVPAKAWYKERVVLASLFFISLMGISYYIDFLKPFYSAAIDYLSMIWWAVLFGFLIGGIIDYFIPRTYVSRHLSESNKKTILYSVVLGFFLSACSHGILAISMELYKKGASIASVVTILLASPWANLPVTVLLFAFFGVKALIIIVSAIVIALITGLIYQVLESKGLIEKSKYKVNVSQDFSVVEDVKIRFREHKLTRDNIKTQIKGVLEGAWSLNKMVGWWIFVGVILAAFARAFIPTHMFEQYLGASISGLFLTLVFATIIEVCSEGSAPLSFEIFRQTGAFGNSFTFLMAGVATDYTELGLIASNIGRRAAIFLPIITVPQVLILGYLFNLFF